MAIKLTGCASLQTIDLTRHWQLSTWNRIHARSNNPGGK